MIQTDLLVVGGGLSGLTLAWHQARAGRTVVVLEAQDSPGGCVHSERLDNGYWFELGAHTCYNSYQALLGLVEDLGITQEILPRQKAPFRMLVDGRVVSITSQLSFGELLWSAPRFVGARKEGNSVRDYYGRIVGNGNYDRVMSAMFAAVPSQCADEFPADLIFKKRERRKDVAKSFTLKGGLQTLTDALAAAPGVQVVTGATATAITKQGEAFAVTTADGRTFLAPRLGLALPPSVGALLMADVAPDLSAALGAFEVAPVESLGVVVPSDATPLGPMAFLVAARDTFYSAVTRDVVPDPAWRGFSFHFKAQTPEAVRLEQICTILQVPRAKVAHVASRRVVLPSPRLGHEVRVAAVERALAAASGVAVVGNYFGGLALEDCVLRAEAESGRLSAATT